MTKYAGKASKLELDNSAGTLTDISTTVYSVDWPYDVADLDVTGFSAAGRERIAGLVDTTFTVRAGFDDAADKSWDVISAWYGAGNKTYKFYPIGGSTHFWTGEAILTSLGISASVDGRIEINASFAASDGNAPTLGS